MIFCIVLFSCSVETKKQKSETKKQKTKITVPVFNADSAYSFIEKQVSFGPRVISSDGWKNCSVWLEKKLSNYTSD